jgi:hypothetical protein
VKNEEQEKRDRKKRPAPWEAEDNEAGEGRFILCLSCYKQTPTGRDYDADFYETGLVREGEGRVYCQTCYRDLRSGSPAVALTFLPGHPTPPPPVSWAPRYLAPDPSGRLQRRHRATRRPPASNPCTRLLGRLLTALSLNAHTRPS